MEKIPKQIAKKYGLKSGNYDLYYLKTHITELKRKFRQKVVILIDGYDSVIQQVYDSKSGFDNPRLDEKIEQHISAFLALITYCELLPSIKLIWITGVTKLDTNVFDEYCDVTFNKAFSTVAGFTSEEIRRHMYPYLQNFPMVFGKTPEPNETMDKIVEWYGGYTFTDPFKYPVKVLNPISVIQCLKNKSFKHYWCEMSKTDLMILFDRFCNEHEYSLKIFINYIVTMDDFAHNCSLYIPMRSRVFYMGCVTMDLKNKWDIVLKYPNKEVKEFLEDRWKRYVPSLKDDIANSPQLTEGFRQKINNSDIPGMYEIIKQFRFQPMGSIWIRYRSTFIEAEACDRLRTLFSYSKIAHNKTGGIDILTHNLPINFAINIVTNDMEYPSVMDSIGDRIREAPAYYPKINVLFINVMRNSIPRAWVNVFIEQNQGSFGNVTASNDTLKNIIEEELRRRSKYWNL